MNKKAFIIGGVVVLIFVIIFVIVFVFQQSSPVQQPATSKIQNTSASVKKKQQKIFRTVTFAPVASTPLVAVRQFYTYYTKSNGNPLSNGAYRTNPYLSPNFKALIAADYKNGDTPVFCPQNKRKNIVVGQETQLNYVNTTLVQEVISEDSPGNKDLYRVTVQEINGKWLIYDINCIP